MKKFSLVMMILASMMLSACSVLNEVSNSIDYVSVATEHIYNLNSFAEKAPRLIEEALNNPELVDELEEKLSNLKVDIEEFIALTDIPTIAEEVHQELVTKNELLLAEINKVLVNGHLALDQLENSQLFTTINEITGLIQRIENLVQ